MRYILALDQGTTSSRAMLIDQSQKIVFMAQKEFRQHYPKEGWVEHDPKEILLTQTAVLDEVCGSCETVREIAAIGITNQRETTVVWDRETGEPVYNAIVWQCRRTADIVEGLKERGFLEHIRKTTGLMPDAYFSATKIRWILDHVPDARKRAEQGMLLFGTIDTWLIWNLTGGRVHKTDYTNASRTMLFDIHRLDWDETLLHALDIPRAMLPDVGPSGGMFGSTFIKGREIPILGVAGDQQAALFGQCGFHAGEAKNTYGTGCFLLMNTGRRAVFSQNGLVTTIAATCAGEPVQYALEGSVFVGGAVIQWLRDGMGVLSESRDAESFASQVEDTGGVYLVPAFTGLGAPHWDMYARGLIIGITRGTERAHIIRAAEEAIAYQCLDLIRAVARDTQTPIRALTVDGGACRDNFLMQFQADVMGGKIIRPECRETTAMGATFLAGLTAGFWNSKDEIRALSKEGQVFEPAMDEATRSKLISGWHRAVERSRHWAEE